MEQTLGKRIMTNRKRLGLTQDQLAEQLGVTAQAVSKWENDQSCPDISILPKLAEIFGISTDALLGRDFREPVHEAKVILEDDEAEPDGLHAQVGDWEFSWDNSKKDGIGFAVLVLTVGVLYLLCKVLAWDLSFWDILWPSSLLIFGLFGLMPRFSLFRLGCALLGGYFLISKIVPLSFEPDDGIVIAVIILLFGISLLVDALRKPAKQAFHCRRMGGDVRRNKQKNTFWNDEESFTYSASFGSCTQYIEMPRLARGDVTISFGEYKLDLSGVQALCDGCTLEANCSFGELKLLVPRRFAVKQNNSTAFAEISVCGYPEEHPEGVIFLDASASFGDIKIQYI